MRSQIIKAIHGNSEVKPDSDFEIGLSEFLKAQYANDAIVELYARFQLGTGAFEQLMRRAVWRALSARFGHSNQISSGAAFKHIETLQIGDSVFIGEQAYIQGWFQGRCLIGNHVWIGPYSFFDARDLIIEDYVGWGPGAKVLGSAHTGMPLDVPIIKTDLEMKTVKIEQWADVGTNAVVLPGVTVGKGSIVGAGAVVTQDVLPFSIVAGAPARFLRWREGYSPDAPRHQEPTLLGQ